MNKILTNTISQVLIRATGSVSTFFVIFLISYSLGYNSVGDFVKITTIVSLLYLLVDFGLNSIFLREHFKDTEKLFANLVAIRISLAGAIFVFLSLLSILLPYNALSGIGFSQTDKIGVIVYAFTLFTQAIMLSLGAISQKYLLSKKLIIPDLISAITLIILVLMGITQNRMIVVLAAYPASEFIGAWLSYMAIKKNYALPAATSEFKSFSKRMLRLSFPLALMLFLNVIFFKADTIILSFLKSSKDVGVYGLAYKVFELLIVFPTFFTASVYPTLIQKKQNSEEFNKHLSRYAIILGFLGFSCAIVTIVLSPTLYFIKPEYILSVTPLQILAFSLPFFFLSSLFQWVFILRNNVKFLLFTYAFSMIFNILANLIFIPRYSYNASAFVTVLSEGLVLLFMVLFFRFSSIRKK